MGLQGKKKTKKKGKDKGPEEAYKWPYYDSYVPNLGMKEKDKRIVRRGIQKQYFPNEQGRFDLKDLRNRQKGIRNIEHQYIDRIKSAASPARRGRYAGSQINMKNHNIGLLMQANKSPRKEYQPIIQDRVRTDEKKLSQAGSQVVFDTGAETDGG